MEKKMEATFSGLGFVAEELLMEKKIETTGII